MVSRCRFAQRVHGRFQRVPGIPQSRGAGRGTAGHVISGRKEIGSGVHTAARKDTAPARQADNSEQEAQRAWDNDPRLRAEFVNLENFRAYLKAERSGKVRILGKPRAQSPSAAPAPASAKHARNTILPELSPGAVIDSAPATASEQVQTKTKKKMVRSAALAKFMLDFPETTGAIVCEIDGLPVPTGRLDGDMTLADFKREWPDIASALIAEIRESRA